MQKIQIRRGVLAELLGKCRTKDGTSIFLGIDDPYFGPVIARCWPEHMPIWHIKLLIGQEISYLFNENDIAIVLKFDHQKNKLQCHLIESLINKGRGSLRNFPVYDESQLEKENNIYVKELMRKRKLESILTLDSRKEIL